jgi:PIN domain nuclease of toxin-antitoxin system
VIYLDTHVLVKLWLGSMDDLGAAARRAISEHDLLASPAAVLELEFLHEIRRLVPTAKSLVATLGGQFGLRVCDLPFNTVVEHALSEKWGRDPFDRLIVANARANSASLVTRDQKIHRHFSRAIW